MDLIAGVHYIFACCVMPALAHGDDRAGLAAYALGFLTTVVVNIPLNNDLVANMTDPTAAREHVEDPWVAWNVVRALLPTVALACLARALVLYAASPRRSTKLSPPDA